MPHLKKRTAVLLVLSLFTWGASAEPSKLAGVARFDLLADSAVQEISDGESTNGNATLARMNWIPAADQRRSYSIGFPISHIGWQQAEVRFTPRGNGSVALTLMGPWEQAAPGTLYRQEVFWDAIEVSGASLPNGGFELGPVSNPTGWQSNGGSIERASDAIAAPEGQRFARTWHNQTLRTTISVTAGKPVAIRLRARAVVPPDFREMKRLDKDTPAHRAAEKFRRGTNFGNYLEAPRGQNWGATYSASDIQRAKAEGFDHVRLPVAWHHYAGARPKFEIESELFAKVDPLINECVKQGLGVIVNIHHFDAFTSDPGGQRPKFLAIWRQLAARYASLPTSVAFELLNEPKDAATTTALNPIYAEVIREIRKTNPDRTIFVGPGLWNRVAELVNLRLPDDDENLIVTVHCYDPFEFTHQGASWVDAPVRSLRGIQFPGRPATPLQLEAVQAGNLRDWIDRYNKLPTERNPSSARAFRGVIEQAKQWSDYYGRPVHMGEFGAYERADAASRANYYRAFREALDEAGIGWAMWDWKAGFRYWDDKTKSPAPGMRDALFPSQDK